MTSSVRNSKTFGHVLVGAAVVVAVWAVPQGGAAQYGMDDPTMRPRIGLRGLFGFGGDAKVEGTEDEGDLETSYGGAAEIEVPIVELLSIGGEVAVIGWTTSVAQDLDVGRNVLTNLSAVPRLRVPFEGDAVHGAFYVGMPVGFSINALNDDYKQALDVFGADVSAGLGYNLGARAGLQFFFTERVGLTAEVEYRYYWFRHRVDGPVGGEEEVDVRLRQLGLHAGLVFTL